MFCYKKKKSIRFIVAWYNLQISFSWYKRNEMASLKFASSSVVFVQFIIHWTKSNHCVFGFLCSSTLIFSVSAWLWYKYSSIPVLFSYIKLSCPNCNNLIIVGCVFIYISVYMVAIDGKRVDQSSLAGLCMVGLPWTFAFKAEFRLL